MPALSLTFAKTLTTSAKLQPKADTNRYNSSVNFRNSLKNRHVKTRIKLKPEGNSHAFGTKQAQEDKENANTKTSNYNAGTNISRRLRIVTTTGTPRHKSAIKQTVSVKGVSTFKVWLKNTWLLMRNFLLKTC